MKKSRWVVSFFIAVSLVLAGAAASTKEKKADKPSAGKNAPPGVALNACGCYRKGNACVCTDKKAKCECPEDCEPVGCEEKRQKEIDREMAAEVKRAQEEDKKRDAAEAAEAARARKAREDRESGSKGLDQAPETTEDKTEDSTADKPSKPARKERDKK